MGNPSQSYGASLAIMGSHSVTCHPTQVNAPRLNPSQPGVWCRLFFDSRCSINKVAWRGIWSVTAPSVIILLQSYCCFTERILKIGQYLMKLGNLPGLFLWSTLCVKCFALATACFCWALWLAIKEKTECKQMTSLYLLIRSFVKI